MLLTAVGMGGYNGWVIQAAVHWKQIECDRVTTRYKHSKTCTTASNIIKLNINNKIIIINVLSNISNGI